MYVSFLQSMSLFERLRDYSSTEKIPEYPLGIPDGVCNSLPDGDEAGTGMGTGSGNRRLGWKMGSSKITVPLSHL